MGIESAILAATAASAAGSAITGISALEQSRLQAALRQKIASAYAQVGQQEAWRKRQEGLRYASAQRALYAATGVSPSEGSPASVQSESLIQAELDALNALWQAHSEAIGERFQASVLRKEAQSAGMALPLTVATKLLEGYTQYKLVGSYLGKK